MLILGAAFIATRMLIGGKLKDSDLKAIPDILNSKFPLTKDNYSLRDNVLNALTDQRENYLKNELFKTYEKGINKIIKNGIKNGETYDQMAKHIKDMFSASGSDIEGWRAKLIAQTEAMWAINEGSRNQLKSLGFKLCEVITANNACPLCIEVAGGNPYEVSQAQGLLPVHPRCRCILGVY